MIKPEYQKPIDPKTLESTINFFEKLMKMLHPFMPFISEELWHELKERDSKDCIIVAEWPKAGKYDEKILTSAEQAFEIITNIRNIRNSKQISPKDLLTLKIKSENFSQFNTFTPVILKLANLEAIESTDKKEDNAASFVLKGDEFFIPLAGSIDLDKEREELQKELEYTRGFLTSVDKKLSNERFVNSAPPQVVEMEKKKKADAEAKLKVLEESLAKM